MPDNMIHPGSFVGDSVEEFKKLPVWGKVLAGGVFVVVGYFGYQAYQTNKSSTAQTVAGTTSLTGTTGAAVDPNAQAASTSPFSSVNGVPLLPSNVNPVEDAAGNLLGYQVGSTTNTSATSPVTASPPATTSQPGGGNAPAPVPVASPSSSNPLVPFGTKIPAQAGAKYSYGGTNYTIVPGGGGRIWGKTSSGQQVLLMAPQSYYKGGGDVSMIGLMTDPLKYLVAAIPHQSAAVPQHRHATK